QRFEHARLYRHRRPITPELHSLRVDLESREAKNTYAAPFRLQHRSPPDRRTAPRAYVGASQEARGQSCHSSCGTRPDPTRVHAGGQVARVGRRRATGLTICTFGGATAPFWGALGFTSVEGAPSGMS